MKFKIFIIIGILLVFGCKNNTSKNEKYKKEPSAGLVDSIINNPPQGMVWIPSGTFLQGAVPQDRMAMQHEKPQHPVKVNGFFMDINEVTNAQFSVFVKETGYITIAERDVDWNVIKKQLPEGTPKPHDSLLQPGSLLFKKTKSSVPNLYDFSQWWHWSIGVNWKHPHGSNSNLDGKANYPVVHVAYEDALAYCKWAKRRLPTEAEWEYAARGNKEESLFFWGNDKEVLSKQANTWEGEFPVNNTLEDGYERTAPVKSYPPNDYGLYDMAGNVWEYTSDWYHANYYTQLVTNNIVADNPKGPDNKTQYLHQKVIKGGSFLCSDSYCASYRISSRMETSSDSSAEHIGFRTVVSLSMLLYDDE